MPCRAQFKPCARHGQDRRLEVELKSDLHDARIVRRRDIAKSAKSLVIPEPGGSFELRVVEDVECLSTELHVDLFVDVEPAQQCEVGIVQAGSVEETAPEVPNCPKGSG